MPANWSVLFYKTLAKYAQQYVEARGDIAARHQILKDCEDDIIKSPLRKKHVVELPDSLCYVSIFFTKLYALVATDY